MINRKRRQSWRQATPEERAHIENIVKREYIHAGDIADALLETVAGFLLLLWMSAPTASVPFYRDWRFIVFVAALVIVGVRRFIASHVRTTILISPLDDIADATCGRMRKVRVFALPESWAEPVIVRYGRRLMRFC